MSTESEDRPPPDTKPPPEILAVFRSFDGFPMETLTKAWVYENLGPRQRSVEEMERHRAAFGASGNCFDLAIWLATRFAESGVRAWFTSNDIEDEHAHVAVIAEAESGHRFLCDLGDMWLVPVAVDRAVKEPVGGLFPGAAITLETRGETLLVHYHRHGGKSSRQSYELTPIAEADFREAAEANQGYLAQRLVEARDFTNQSHWEYENGVFRASTHEGLFEEQEPADPGATAARIEERTGMKAPYVEACLTAFERLTS